MVFSMTFYLLNPKKFITSHKHFKLLIYIQTNFTCIWKFCQYITLNIQHLENYLQLEVKKNYNVIEKFNKISKYILLKYILLKREIQKDIFKKLSIRHKKVCFCIFYFFVFVNFVNQPISVNSDIYRFWNVIRGIIRVIGDGIIYGNAIMWFSDSGISMSSTRQLFR